MTDDEIRALGWIRVDAQATAADESALQSEGWVRQSRRAHTLHGTPRAGQVFWVDFPHDAYAPEFVGEHPGVVIRSANNLSEPVILVPLTHRDPGSNPHAHKLLRNPDPRDAEASFAICNHLYTVALGRLRRFEVRGFPRDVFLDQQDLAEVFDRVQRVLARVFSTLSPLPLPPVRLKPPGPRTLSLKPKA